MSNHYIDNLAGVYEHTGTVISAVGTEQLELPTPCTEWNVRELESFERATDLARHPLEAERLRARVTRR